MKPWVLLGVSFPAWIWVPIFLAGWVVFGFALKAVLFSRLHRLAQRTASKLDDVLIRALGFPLVMLILVSSPVALVNLTPTGTPDSQRTLNLALAATAILAAIIFTDRLIRGLIEVYAERVEFLRTAGGLLKGLERGVIVALGALMLMETLGIEITPVLATLGIGSLAVALALQPTLENLFAGIQIVVDRPVQKGHYIKLDSGEEGYVERIGWRTTWIRMLPNNMVIIPNKQLVSSRVLNYYYPSKDLAVLVQVGVHYDSDLRKVEQVTVEVAEEVQKTVQGAVPDFKPFIRYHTFNSSSIDFTVILRAQEFVDNFLLKHEFIKALQARYAKEGITIPFPIRAINLEQEGAARVLSRAKASR
ncbi:MAG: mechanosensitive ion channel family protein [Planctomycetes bacterium]|nr:mechanosensitive ion channel family protein [Planctomycetota bacterium]